MTDYTREKKLALDEARISERKTTQNVPDIFMELISSTKTPKETFDDVVSDMFRAVGKTYTPAGSPADKLHEPPEGSIFNPKTDPQIERWLQNPDNRAAAESWSADTWRSAWGPGEKPSAWGTNDALRSLTDSDQVRRAHLADLHEWGSAIRAPEKSAVPRKDEEPLPPISGRKKTAVRNADTAAIDGDLETSRKEAEKYDALDAANPNRLTAKHIDAILSTTGHKFFNSIANALESTAYGLFSASGAAQRVEQDKRRIAAGMPGTAAASPFDQMAYSFYTWKDPLKEGELLTDRMWAIEEAMRRGEPVTYPQAVLDMIDKKRAEAGEGLEGWRKWIYEGGINAADLITVLSATGLSAGESASNASYLLLNGLSAGGYAANSARQRGASPEEQLGYGAVIGVSEALVEGLTAIGGSEYARRFGGELLQNLPPDVSVWISRNFLADNPAGRVVRGAFGEAMEEGLLYDINYLAQNLFLDPDTPYDIREKLRQMLYSGVAGGTYRLGTEVGFGSVTPRAGQAGALEFDYDAAARYYDMQNLTRDQLVLFGGDAALRKLKTPAERRAYIRKHYFPRTAESRILFEHVYPPYHALPVDLRSPEAQKVFAEFDAGLYTDFAVMPSEQRAYEIGRLLGVEADSTETVTYWRVQGGDGSNRSQDRIVINPDGTIRVTNPDKNLNISARTDEHASYFLDKRGSNAYIVEFEVPKWFDDFLNEYVIDQKDATTNPNNMGGMAPKRVDPNRPGFAYELPPPWIEWLEEYALNAKIVKGGAS